MLEVDHDEPRVHREVGRLGCLHAITVGSYGRFPHGVYGYRIGSRNIEVTADFRGR